MKIKKLVKEIPGISVKGSKEVEISGVCSNSKVVAPGNLFIAKKGRIDNGSDYIEEAIAAGAVAIVTDMYDPSLDIVQLIHSDVGGIEGMLAAQYYQFPSNELFTVGITGTNGKTTTSYLIKWLLDNLDGPCGLIGTIENVIGNFRYQATRTTPDVCSNQKMLREMVLQGCNNLVMEVTSHALDQNRVESIAFDVAVFTNLTSDHLDYHLTLNNYAVAKQKLFSSLDPDGKKKIRSFPKTAVVNVDSDLHLEMIKNCRAEILTYGLSANADLRASEIEQGPKGTAFKMHYKDQVIQCRSPFIGLYNVYNYLAALGAVLTKGIPSGAAAECLDRAPNVPGRLESVPNASGLNIYVDYAHTADALKKVLECLQAVKKGRILTVFGCGGDRDKSKRPKMGEVSGALSDFTFVTSDNPRSEDPNEICKEIVSGFKENHSYLVEVDRREAIKKAIEMARPNDIVLIAGKGHEPYQIFAHHTIAFDDRLIAAELCGGKAL